MPILSRIFAQSWRLPGLGDMVPSTPCFPVAFKVVLISRQLVESKGSGSSSTLMPWALELPHTLGHKYRSARRLTT